MIELLLVLFIALIAFSCLVIWKHDNSDNRFWRSNVWAVVVAVCLLVGVFGVIFTLGLMFGGVLN